MSTDSSTYHVSNTDLDSVLTPLKVINKRAKNLGSEAHSCHITLNKESEQKEIKKNALYEVKKKILLKIHDKSNRVEKHIIRENEFYCFYFGDQSFHVPVSSFPISIEYYSTRRLNNFDPIQTNTTNMSLQSSLVRINNLLGINANDCLKQQSVYSEHKQDFIDLTWECLP